MLMVCPECQGKVSDKAQMCPHCGYPINAQIVTKKRKKSTRRKLPNGSGSIQKLTGNRKHPYAAYPPCDEYKENGVAVRKKAIGYFETYNEAFLALSKYIDSPYDLEKDRTTFSDVFQLLKKQKFEDSAKKMSESSRRSYEAAFSNCQKLHKKLFKSINADDMQSVIDNCGLGYSSRQNIVVLFKSMYDYAIPRDLANKNYAEYVSINMENDAESGEPFSEEQLKILWENKEDKVVQMILIMIYTGHRISEYKVAEIDLEQRTITGGLKNKKSKERVVPISRHIIDFIPDMMIKDYTVNSFRNKKFYPTLEQLGISEINGKKHTPHDTRHTFSWLCDKYGVEKMSKSMMMGHALGTNIEEKVYGHRTLDELRNEIEKIENPYLS